MNDVAAPEGPAPTSTATTVQTEPAVLAAIASGEGDPMREQAIRERAYAIWEEEGTPDGKDLDHWLRAAAEIDLRDHSVVDSVSLARRKPRSQRDEQT